MSPIGECSRKQTSHVLLEVGVSMGTASIEGHLAKIVKMTIWTWHWGNSSRKSYYGYLFTFE